MIRSVAHPDRYVQADAGVVKLDPTATPVRRVTVRNGVKIKVDDGYLKQVGRAISVAPAGTLFQLS